MLPLLLGHHLLDARSSQWPATCRLVRYGEPHHLPSLHPSYRRGWNTDASRFICTPPRARVRRGEPVSPLGYTGYAALILNRDRFSIPTGNSHLIPATPICSGLMDKAATRCFTRKSSGNACHVPLGGLRPLHRRKDGFNVKSISEPYRTTGPAAPA